MTPSELKLEYQAANPTGHFFDRKTLKFFGDSMRNYGVRSVTVLAQFDEDGNYVEAGIPTDVWELYRRRPSKHGLASSAYFRKSNFQQIHCIK